MKNFKNSANTIFAFDDDCFDEEGKCINEYALKVIEENNLIEITQEEAEAIRNYKSPEQLAEEERLAKLPSQEDLEKSKFEIIAIEMLMQLKEEGVI